MTVNSASPVSMVKSEYKHTIRKDHQINPFQFCNVGTFDPTHVDHIYSDIRGSILL